MKPLMIIIKKYWKLFVGSILAIFGIGLIASKQTNVEVKAIDKEIEHNNNEIEKIDIAIENVAETKIEVKKRITTKNKKIVELETEKKDVPNKYRTVSEAKQNIIKKTQRTK
jgi:archaellum component FlaC